jgi:predicted ATPase/DNA-binding SARP family transcriptional activator
MPHLEITLFAKPEIRQEGKTVGTDRRKAVGLLAYLATEAGQHPREALAALLWPDYPQSSAYAYLRRTLWELNQMLGEGWIEADRRCAWLVLKPELSVDALTFERLLEPGGDEVSKLSEAIGLYRGDFLQGLMIADTAPFEEWQLQKAEYYRRQLVSAYEKLVRAYESNREYELALPYAQEWQQLDPLNEAAYRAVMRQMAGMGNRSGAVRVYQTCADRLKNELGVSPQEETESLYQAILQGETPNKPSSMPTAEAGAAPRMKLGNLPTPSTPFVGRGEEIRQVEDLLQDPNIRLLTMTGPGGTGKTRLSIQVAARVQDSFAEGAWFIPLVALQSSQGIILAIAKGLDFSFYKGEQTPLQQLLDFLREKRALIVLDNFEHLLDGGRQLVTDILEAAPNLKLLVTSRQRLNLLHEQVFRVGGMKTPDAQTMAKWDEPLEQAECFSAIQLLVERARRVQPEFRLTSQNLQAITQICRMVDGSPLAIELAAAWLELLPVEEITREISHSLDFLESSSADVPVRQRSLRAVFDTSWNLLNTIEQQAFQRLCAFRGSFSRQAAEVVSGAKLGTLLGLANKSWLQLTDQGRYQLHEVLRQYGLERLECDQKEWQDTYDRLAEYFSNFTYIQGQALKGAGQIQALEALRAEMESNIPAAWTWLVLSDRIDDLIEKMLPGIFQYWMIRIGTDDFISMLKQARNSIPETQERINLVRQAILETVETNLEMNLAAFEEHPKEHMEDLWNRVHELNLKDEMGFWYVVLVASYGGYINFQEAAERVAALIAKIVHHLETWELGNLYLWSAILNSPKQSEIPRQHLMKALEMFRKVGSIHDQGIVLQELGEQVAKQMDYEQAIQYTQAAHEMYEQTGDVWGVDTTWRGLGEYYTHLGKFEQAFQAYEHIRQFNEKMGNRRLLGRDLSWESLAVSRYGDLEYALELRKRSLEIAIEVGDQNDLAWHTWELGEIYRLMGKMEQAKKYYQEAQPLFEKIGEFNGLGFYHRGLGDIARENGDWEEATRQYRRALEFHETEQRLHRFWGLALTEARLGSALVQLGAGGEARRYFRKSLQLADELADRDLMALPLLGIAEMLAASGAPGRAIELAACVAFQPTTWNEVRKQAKLVVDKVSGDVPADEVKNCIVQGEGQEIHQLCKMWLERDELD